MKIAQHNLLKLAQSKPTYAPYSGGRIEVIDWVRGVAVALMILNHGVKGLLPFEDFPQWGLVPVHMITRFASSTFIIVFGIGLAIVFIPGVPSAKWPQRRLKLLVKGVIIYFWYKVLTVLEMLPYEPEQILDALTYRAFPSFVEILGFYAVALLWIPFFLPVWRRLPLWSRLLSPLLVALLSYLLLEHFHFWGLQPVQALLVEHENHYTWGQLSRAPLILIGLLLGELIARYYHKGAARRWLGYALTVTSITLFALFIVLNDVPLYDALLAIAYNEGKHPPQLQFMLLSLGGAAAILATAMFGGERLALLLRPFTVIGRDALHAFIFHIAVIFVLLRYLLGYWHEISYHYALTLTLCLILATALWIKFLAWVQAHS